MFHLRSLVCLIWVSGLSTLTSNLIAVSNSTDRIIGDNDFIRIPASAENNPIVKAIGRIELGCTATHLGGGLAISAGHCFGRWNFDGIQKNVPCADEKYSVEWGVTYDSEAYLTSECVEIVARELNEKRDYAIFRVYPIPNSSLEVSNENASVSQKISIYSHPRKRPLEWSQWCTVEGYVEKSAGNQFYYSCDTEGGSSGAAVLDRRYRIVGIHNYYNGILNRNGATKITSTPLRNILLSESLENMKSALAQPHVRRLLGTNVALFSGLSFVNFFQSELENLKTF